MSDEASLKGWVNFAKEQGLEALAVKHHRRRYNLDFKLKVVEYYQTHAVGVSKVAAIFNIPASQVYSWDRAFKLGELSALIPRQKGRPRLMKKKPVKSTHQSALSLSEKHSYEEEILRLKEQLFRTEMERDILKKLPAVGSLSNKAKTLAVDSVRGDRKNRCTVNDLLTFFDLKHATYDDEKKRLLKTNKYQQIQNMIQNIFLVSHKTYGYRHIHRQLLNQGVKISANTGIKLMHILGIKNHIYRRHTISYSSYKGNIGLIFQR